MNRRDILATAAAVVGGAGIVAIVQTQLGSGTDGNQISVTGPTVTQGETGTVTLEADSVVGIRFEPAHDRDLIDFEDASFSPPPDKSYLTDPPAWAWSSPTDVSGELPVTPSSSTPTGTYRYDMVCIREDDREITKSLTVTVRE